MMRKTPPKNQMIQRLRVKFSRGEELKYISHLDITRLWQRALVRAGVRLAYSEGFNPRPRLSLAAPLALGITSEAELLDVYCHGMPSPHWFRNALTQQLPDGIAIIEVQPVPLLFPALQAQIQSADYVVTVAAASDETTIRSNIERLMEAEKIPWQHQRDTGVRQYDLRRLIFDFQLADFSPEGCMLAMRLRCDNTGSGRPEQVAAAAGFQDYPAKIHRRALHLSLR